MSDSFITEAMVETALNYLAQEPHPIAVAKGELTRAENLRKVVRARVFMMANGKTIAEREATAEASDEYQKAIEREAKASETYESARAKIAWATTAIECWRTANANARAAERVR